MYKRAALVWMMVTVAAALWGEELPKSIVSYYEDWNFVALHSTLQQREALWSAYRRSDRALLPVASVKLLTRMTHIVQATEEQESSMPMLLAGQRPPVTSEMLVPFKQSFNGDTEIVVQVKVMQLPTVRDRKASKLRFGSNSGPASVSMCQYTDRWTQRGGEWKVLRSPFVWVAVE